MNVIISNKYTSLLKSLDITIIKSLEGEFDVDEIINTFENFYFNKMIIDVTAIRNYKSINIIQRLCISFDVSKLILLLDNDEQIVTNTYLSQLVSVGIYNFTRNLDGVKYLLDHPNSYKDVAHIQELTPQVVVPFAKGSGSKTIIGVKNLNEHAGSTSLIYMMKKILDVNYSVVAIEVNKRDFYYFNDMENMISTTTSEFPKVLLSQHEANIILVDLNDYGDTSICTDVLYLVDPGLISVNKMIKRFPRVFDEYNDKKVILNRSALDEAGVASFEYESRLNFFDVIPNVDMRQESDSNIYDLLRKMGYVSEIE